MIDLLTTVNTLALGLTEGALFPSPSGEDIAIAYKLGDYPYKTGGDQDVPICVTLLRTFNTVPSVTATVHLAFTLYTSNGSAAAMADIKRLLGLLKPLALRSSQYKPWKLDKVGGFVGDSEHGAHPDPYYYLTYALEFSTGRLL